MHRSRARKLFCSRAMRDSAGTASTLLRHAPIAAAVLTAIQGAHAQEAPPGSSGGLEEVVVTASKRAENLQDVPISVEALDTRRLQQMNIQNFNDYAQALPEVAYQSLQPGFSRTFMRGVSSDNNPNHSGPLPSVGTYLDEQPITTIQGPLDLHVYDIARVEVLPGPQGTLYGASSEAGTIRIITNKPDPAGFKAGYDVQGNSLKNGTAGGIAEGFVNVPLSSNAALRLVGWYERDSGYIDNVPGTLTYPGSAAAGVPPFTLNNAAIAQKHYNPTDIYGGRAALKVDLNDRWSVTPVLIAQKTKWDGIFGQEVWKDLADGSPVPGDLAVKHFYPEGGYDDWFDAALTVQGKIGNFDVTYAGAYLRRTDHTSSDYTDYSLGYEQYASYWPANPSQVILGDDRYQMFSNELRVTSPKDYPVRFVAGLFQQRQQHGIQQRYVINGLNPIYWVGTGTPYEWPDTWWLTEQVRVNRDSAVFGELNWDVTSQLTLTGGFRHFDYKNTLEGFYGFSPNTFGGTEGQFTCFIQTPFHGAPCEDLDKRADGTGWTPKVNLAYKFDPARMLYLTWSKGFRPGGVNRVGNFTPYSPDYLKNYEAGWKTTWFDNHLRFNGAVFREDWTNFQFSFLGPNSVTIVENSPQARVNGLESDFEWRAVESLTFSGGVALMHAYLTADYCGTTDANGNPITSCPGTAKAPSGTVLPITPRFKGNLTARYTFPLMSWEGHVQGSYVYQSAVWPDLRLVERSLLGQQGAFGLVNLFIGAEKNSLSLELLAKNLFDKRASTYRYAECTETTCAPIAVYNVIAPPRLIGLQIGQRF